MKLSEIELKVKEILIKAKDKDSAVNIVPETSIKDAHVELWRPLKQDCYLYCDLYSNDDIEKKVRVFMQMYDTVIKSPIFELKKLGGTLFHTPKWTPKRYFDGDVNSQIRHSQDSRSAMTLNNHIHANLECQPQSLREYLDNNSYRWCAYEDTIRINLSDKRQLVWHEMNGKTGICGNGQIAFDNDKFNEQELIRFLKLIRLYISEEELNAIPARYEEGRESIIGLLFSKLLDNGCKCFVYSNAYRGYINTRVSLSVIIQPKLVMNIMITTPKILFNLIDNINIINDAFRIMMPDDYSIRTFSLLPPGITVEDIHYKWYHSPSILPRDMYNEDICKVDILPCN